MKLGEERERLKKKKKEKIVMKYKTIIFVILIPDHIFIFL